MEGYKSIFNNSLVTVWSAPNYCGRCGNVATILELDENLDTNFTKFVEAPRNEDYEKKMAKANPDDEEEDGEPKEDGDSVEDEEDETEKQERKAKKEE